MHSDEVSQPRTPKNITKARKHASKKEKCKSRREIEEIKDRNEESKKKTRTKGGNSKQERAWRRMVHAPQSKWRDRKQMTVCPLFFWRSKPFFSTVFWKKQGKNMGASRAHRHECGRWTGLFYSNVLCQTWERIGKFWLSLPRISQKKRGDFWCLEISGDAPTIGRFMAAWHPISVTWGRLEWNAKTCLSYFSVSSYFTTLVLCFLKYTINTKIC